jgi:hypothetical protein
MKPTHTPGPWKAEGLTVIGAHGLSVCEVEDHVHADYDNSSDASDNARAIAALPDLIAALERAVASEMLNKADDLAARAALAKAKGDA